MGAFIERHKNRIFTAIAVLGLLYNYTREYLPQVSVPSLSQLVASASGAPASARTVEDTLSAAIAAHAQDLAVTGEGTVTKLLPDDTEGDRHQRFLLNTASGQSVLIAHNIDLAPRVDSLKPGDTVRFAGEYVWNTKGGVIHWTHRDPHHRHPDGWLELAGKRYQ